jgi:hypothetical protein
MQCFAERSFVSFLAAPQARFNIIIFVLDVNRRRKRVSIITWGPNGTVDNLVVSGV